GGFDREGPGNPAVEVGRGRRGSRSDGVVPETIEVRPALAHELRPRVLTPCVVRRDLFSPCGPQVYRSGFPTLCGGGKVDAEQGRVEVVCAGSFDDVAAGVAELIALAQSKNCDGKFSRSFLRPFSTLFRRLRSRWFGIPPSTVKVGQHTLLSTGNTPIPAYG